MDCHYSNFMQYVRSMLYIINCDLDQNNMGVFFLVRTNKTSAETSS